MKPFHVYRLAQQRWAYRVQRVAIAALLWCLALAIALIAGATLGGCASDLDDMEAMAAESVAERVWFATWARHDPGTFGKPPPIFIEEGDDPRCSDPRAIYLGGGDCGFGQFIPAYKDDKGAPAGYFIRLAKFCDIGCIGHELAHAAASLMPAPFPKWSLAHTPEFWHQVCRAEFHHSRIIDRPLYDDHCPKALMAEIAAKEPL